jgi:uroporphyrinogen III methyltransferase/synthase
MTARVLVTRASDQADRLEAALRDAGLEPIVAPAIAVEIDPPGGALDSAARVLHTFDWVVLTSPNGAKALLTAVRRVSTASGTPLYAAIGDGTARVLEREGVGVDFRPSRADGMTLGAELPLHPGQEVLLLRGDLAGEDLPARLRDRGALVTDVVAYRTIEGPTSTRPILRNAIAAGPQAVLFASGSAARGLVALAGAEGLDISSIPAICIGPETAREAERLGFRVLAISPEADAPFLAATAAAALTQPLEIR